MKLLLKPFDVAFVDGSAMRRVQFDMPFIGINIHFNRPTPSPQVAIGGQAHPKFAGGRLDEKRHWSGLRRVDKRRYLPE